MSVIVRSFAEPPICEREILRYAGCREASEDVVALMHECFSQVRRQLSYRVVYRELPLHVTGNQCDFGVLSCCCEALAKRFKEAETAVLFAATIGVAFDRQLARYTRTEPAKALMLQAIGTERIEALCDVFCDELAKETGTFALARFSPGYGDLPLSLQRDIVALLDTPKYIGVSLSDSLLMIPSKSVTAFVGLSSTKAKIIESKCAFCDKRDCAFRGVL